MRAFISLLKRATIKGISTACNLFGYQIYLAPYSGWSSPVYLIYSKNNEFMGQGLRKFSYFGKSVWCQSQDLRAYVRSIWDEESSRIKALFDCSNLFAQFDFFDIGANYGLYSLPFASNPRVGSCVLVEANPFLVTCLEKTFLDTRARVINKALWKSDDVNLLFNIRPFASGASSLNLTHATAPLQSLGLKLSSIGIKTLFGNHHQSRSAIVKLDIEGGEIDLLQENLLFASLSALYDDYVVMMEYIPKQYNVSQLAFLRKALSASYCCPLANFNFIESKTSKPFEFSHGSISDFYDLNCQIGVEWFDSDPSFEYADILIFSSGELADKFMAMMH